MPKGGCFPISEITQCSCPYLADKSCNKMESTYFSILCLKHVAALELDVNLQVRAKTLLRKQRHKVKNMPAMD